MIGVGVFFILYEQCEECHQSVLNNSTTTTTTMSTTTTTAASVMSQMMPDTYVTQETVDNVGFLPLVSLMLFIAAFSLGFGPIPWILNVELIPPEARVSFFNNFCTFYSFEST